LGVHIVRRQINLLVSREQLPQRLVRTRQTPWSVREYKGHGQLRKGR
jgi:hypothetical protein